MLSGLSSFQIGTWLIEVNFIKIADSRASSVSFLYEHLSMLKILPAYQTRNIKEDWV